jgi:hypothetical protein
MDKGVGKHQKVRPVAAKTEIRVEFHNEMFCGDTPIAVEPGGWLPPENTVPMEYASTADLLSERFKNAIYLIARTGQQGAYFPSSGKLEPGEKCQVGTWRVLVSVMANNVQAFQFASSFG